MSPSLSVRACLRAGPVLVGAALLVTGCSGAAAPPIRPVAAVTSTSGAQPSPDAPLTAGGMDYSTNVLLNDTWTWDGRDWTSR